MQRCRRACRCDLAQAKRPACCTLATHFGSRSTHHHRCQYGPRRKVHLPDRVLIVPRPRNAAVEQDPSGLDPLRGKTALPPVHANRPPPVLCLHHLLRDDRYEMPQSPKTQGHHDQYDQTQGLHRRDQAQQGVSPVPHQQRCVQNAPEMFLPNRPHACRAFSTLRFGCSLSTHTHGRQTVVRQRFLGVTGSSLSVSIAVFGGELGYGVRQVYPSRYLQRCRWLPLL